MEEIDAIRQRRAAAWEGARAQREDHAAEDAAEDDTKTNPSRPTERSCRICFDSLESKETGRLFSPCQCTGSMSLVHVSCLNDWRSASCNDRSYYRCDACHFEYRLQRLWIADVLISPGFHLALTISLFAVSALVVGILGQLLTPWVVEWSLDHLHLAPNLRFLFSEYSPVNQGNPACWQQGYTFQVCCSKGRPGNPICWDDLYDFDTCCLGVSKTLQSFKSIFGPLLRVLCCGWLGLSVVGFCLYLQRQLQEAWGNAGGSWQMVMLVAYLSSFGHALARLVAVVGSAIALKELFLQLQRHGKRAASNLGERVLEVQH